MEISVPKQSTVFAFDDGRSHEVSLLAAVESAMEIFKKWEKIPGYGYADDFKTWWEANAKSADGKAVITRDEANWLYDMVFIEAARQKKSRMDTLPSSTSTALSPTE